MWTSGRKFTDEKLEERIFFETKKDFFIRTPTTHQVNVQFRGLTHFQRMFHFYTPENRFSDVFRSLEVEH